MVKLLGAVMTGLSCGYFGFRLSASLKKRIKSLGDIVSSLELLESGEAPSESDELGEWCSFYFGLYPGIDDNMWFLYPDFSIRWSGLCGVAEYDEFAGSEEMDEYGLVPVSCTVARSPEANIFLLAETEDGYYLQNAEAFYASHT